MGVRQQRHYPLDIVIVVGLSHWRALTTDFSDSGMGATAVIFVHHGGIKGPLIDTDAPLLAPTPLEAHHKSTGITVAQCLAGEVAVGSGIAFLPPLSCTLGADVGKRARFQVTAI